MYLSLTSATALILPSRVLSTSSSNDNSTSSDDDDDDDDADDDDDDADADNILQTNLSTFNLLTNA